MSSTFTKKMILPHIYKAKLDGMDQTIAILNVVLIWQTLGRQSKSKRKADNWVFIKIVALGKFQKSKQELYTLNDFSLYKQVQKSVWSSSEPQKEPSKAENDKTSWGWAGPSSV